MTLPDWVLNGTTYKDLGTVGDFSMMWNFNTREKARLTGGLFSKFLPSLLSWPFCRGACEWTGTGATAWETRKGLEPKCVPSLGSLLGARRWAKRIRQWRRPWKRRWKIDFASSHFFRDYSKGLSYLKEGNLVWSWREGTALEFWQRW